MERINKHFMREVAKQRETTASHMPEFCSFSLNTHFTKSLTLKDWATLKSSNNGDKCM